MKRNFAPKTITFILLIASSLYVTSCSSLWSHRENKENKDNIDKSKLVPREQYDELARKYKELLDQMKNEKKAVVASTNTSSEIENEKKSSDDQLKPEATASTNIDPSELVNHIDQKIPDSKVIEGVDVTGPVSKNSESVANNKIGPDVPTTMGIEHVNSTDDIDDQISKLREATELIKVNKFENALVVLKELENSKEKQIVVRAKVMLGDLLFNQGEYDLSMQVYEEVIKKYSFSGFVLKALGRLVACSEKLKLVEKQAKYYSLLHDFFEAT